jgi:MFS family permease
LRLIYALLLAGFLLLAGATAWLPVAGAARKPVSLRPQLHLERTIRPAFWAVLPCLVATWAIGGLYLSLGPSLFLSLSQSGNRLLGGSIVFALCAAGALIGLAITITATAAANAALLFLGTIVAGAGFGSAFLGAFRSLAAQATPGGRAGLIAAIYIAAYLAFSLPAIGAGVLTTQLGLRLTAIGYAAVVAALTGAALIATAPVSTRERPTPAGRMRRLAGKAHESPSEGAREQDSS